MIETNDYSLINEANEKLANMCKKHTNKALKQVLHVSSLNMKNGYNRSDN